MISVLRAPEFALAAVAAAAAFFAAVVGAGVFRAIRADLGRRLVADAAGIGGRFGHDLDPYFAGAWAGAGFGAAGADPADGGAAAGFTAAGRAAGCRIKLPRQRWAS